MKVFINVLGFHILNKKQKNRKTEAKAHTAQVIFRYVKIYSLIDHVVIR